MTFPLRTRARCRAFVVAWLLVAGLGAKAADPPATTTSDRAAVFARVAELLERAENLGARRELPGNYRDVERRLAEARQGAPTPQAFADLETDARRLVNRAAFVKEVRRSRSPLETIANRFDAVLGEIATIEGVDLDPGLSGEEAASHLLDLLAAQRHASQVRLDSLRVEVARLTELSGGRVAAQDSVITSLRAEVSELRRRLWATELRAGVAEADRSAAESALVRRQQQEQAIKEIREQLGKAGDVVLMPEGEIVLRVHGLTFGVGSAKLAAGQEKLVGTLADAVQRFPGAVVRVEGHTDDTGGRQANLELSQQRAAAVAALLAKRLDRDAATIATLGHGPDRPVAPNSTAEGRARNRRIDVVIVPVS